MMQQSPRLYASPHAGPLRVAALPPEGVNLPWGGPAEDCQPPRWATACGCVPFALSLSKGACRRELVEGGI